MEQLIGIVFFVAVCFQLYVFVRLVDSKDFDTSEKTIAMLILFCVPVIGAIMAFLRMRTREHPDAPD